jgi:hypothetical protein
LSKAAGAVVAATSRQQQSKPDHFLHILIWPQIDPEFDTQQWVFFSGVLPTNL